MKIAFVTQPVADFSAMDIGITALATYLNERTDHFHQASIIDLVFHRRHWREFLRAELRRQHPDFVGISCNKLYMPYVKELIREIDNMGLFHIVLGGHEATMHPEEMLELGCDVCTGDGETSLPKLLEHKALSYAQPRIYRGSFIQNLHHLTIPDWSLWQDLDKYLYFLGMIYGIGSRGCPHKCTFCDAWPIADKVDGCYFRLIDPTYYAASLHYMALKYKPRMFQLFDPVFTVSLKWLEAFTRDYARTHPFVPQLFGPRLGAAHLPFSVFARIDELDAGRIALLAQAGCRIVRVGIEAGDERIRNEVYQKHVSNKQVREAFRWLRHYGIKATAYYILGGPTETPRTVRSTIDLAREVGAERTVFFVYKCLTNAGESQMEQCGATLHSRYSDNIAFGAIADQDNLPAWRVNLYQIEAYARTLPKRYWRLIRKQRHHFFTGLIRYMWRGRRNGLSWKYLAAYFTVYGGDNLYD